MATLCEWNIVMYQANSLSGIDYDMINNNSQYNSLFFIIFVLIGAFFMLNLFVGIVISTFNREKDKLDKDYLLKER
jgi:hypothetical protein